MIIKPIYLIVMLGALTLAFTFGNLAAANQDLRRPSLTIDKALGLARRYVESHRIDVFNHYIDSVKLDLNPRGDRGNRWVIIYERSEYVKGGQIILHVYLDKLVKHFFGE